MSSPDHQYPKAGLSRFTQQLLLVVLGMICLVLTVHLLREFATILKPLFIAGFIAYLVIPAHLWLVQRGINRPLAGLALIVIIIAIFSFLGLLVYDNADTLVEKWPSYQARWNHMTASLLDSMPATVKEMFNQQNRQQWGGTELRNMLSSFLGTFINFLTATAVVIIYLAFMLAERASLPGRLERAFGKERADQLLGIFASISQAISQYIGVKTFISVLGGVFTTLILLAFGVDFAFTWGALAFLFNFIPYLGSLVATVLPVLLAIVQLENPWTAVIIGGLLVAMQQFLGVVIEPRMAGAKLGVSPLLIILSLAFWGVIWGIVGMLLAVPLLMITKIIFENIPATKPVAALMGK